MGEGLGVRELEMVTHEHLGHHTSKTEILYFPRLQTTYPSLLSPSPCLYLSALSGAICQKEASEHHTQTSSKEWSNCESQGLKELRPYSPSLLPSPFYV